MKTVSCKDMGINCPWMGKAETMEELAQQTKEHAMTKHPEYYEEKMSGMSQQEMTDMMKPFVKEE